MTKTKLYFLFSILLFISSPLLAEKCIKPTGYDIKYDPDYKGYLAKNTYEQKGKILYIVYTVESGPYIGVQLFCNPKGSNIAKDLPDSYVEGNGKKYYVYDYGSHWIYHSLNDEFLIEF